MGSLAAWSAAPSDEIGEMAVLERLEPYHVVWTTPGTGPVDSMPLGNGDVALNVWTERHGDVAFYLAKTDAWSQNGELLKLGRVRLQLEPNPFAAGQPFTQTLRLRDASVEVRGGEREAAARVRLWVDAHHPTVHLEVESARPVQVRATPELWRAEDHLQRAGPDRIVWYHRNETSNFVARLQAHHLEGFERQRADPLLHRTFGALLAGSDLQTVGGDGAPALASPGPVRSAHLRLTVLTAITPTAAEWMDQLAALDRAGEALPLSHRWEEHARWWQDFWSRSWIFVRCPGNPAEGEKITGGYLWQRFISACAGRGAYPIKFNGSLFTVDWPEPESQGNPDYRRWGPDYWHQNTRLVYWPMLASGDWDLMAPFFRLYLDTLPLQRERTRRYFGHAGAYWPETMNFWGLSRDEDYGVGEVRQGQPISYHHNRYIRYHWQGALETAAMMLDYYAWSGNEDFVAHTLWPFVREVLTFYDQHYPRSEQGRIRLEPAQALETWWDCVDPLPEIAGLHWVLGKLLALPEELVPAEDRSFWQRLQTELPEIPRREVGGQILLAPAREFATHQNCENPELYAIFPYRLYGVGKPDLEMARATFAARLHPMNWGWAQDETQMAFLGLAEEARRALVDRASRHYAPARFPAFWGPNFDWIPDQDHGGNLLMALQTMLLQAEDEAILLFPAWPEDWEVDFRLWAPRRTRVEGRYHGGRLQQLQVTPEDRRDQVQVLLSSRASG